jgi:hypothetical protein
MHAHPDEMSAAANNARQSKAANTKEYKSTALTDKVHNKHNTNLPANT